MKIFRFLLLAGLLLILALGAFAPFAAQAEVARHGGTPEPGAPADAASSVSGDQTPADIVSIREIRFDPHLDAQVPLDLAFRDETGRAVRLGDYLGDKPLLISINDFTCQDLCPLELQNLVDAMDQVTLRLGADYKALAISLNPANTTQDASTMRDDVVHRYKRPDAPNGADGWHFLTAEQPAITALTDAVGLKYAYDAASKSYAHPVGVVVLTPQGKIARYLYGMDFPSNDLRLAIYEAGQGKISDPITPILLLCYHYDVSTGRYTNVALALVRAGGIATVLGLGTFIGVMLRRDVRGRKATGPAPPRGTARSKTMQFPFLPPAGTTHAQDVDKILLALLLLSLFFVGLVAALIIYAAVRYRRRSRTQFGTGHGGNSMIEWGGMAFLGVLSLGMFLWAGGSYINALSPPPDAEPIFITGRMWMWKAEHQNGQREINTLHLQVNKPYKLVMTSEDVIHDFYVPAFRIHTDVLPGRYTTQWFTPTEVGTYHLFCSQYCGTGHALMGGDVMVQTEADYQKWSGGGTQATTAETGAQLFQQSGCIACHSGAAGAPAPDLVGLFGSQVQLADGQTVTSNEDYIRESILNPTAKVVKGFQPIMPSYQGRLTEAEVFAMVAYIKSLGTTGGGASAPAAVGTPAGANTPGGVGATPEATSTP